MVSIWMQRLRLQDSPIKTLSFLKLALFMGLAPARRWKSMEPGSAIRVNTGLYSRELGVNVSCHIQAPVRFLLDDGIDLWDVCL